MRRADNRNFEGDVSGVQIENIVDIHTTASARVENGNTLVFNGKNRDPVAFAYKAGQLRLRGKGFEFFPEEVQHFAQKEDNSSEPGYTYQPLCGLVLKVEDVQRFP